MYYQPQPSPQPPQQSNARAIIGFIILFALLIGCLLGGFFLGRATENQSWQDWMHYSCSYTSSTEMNCSTYNLP